MFATPTLDPQVPSPTATKVKMQPTVQVKKPDVGTTNNTGADVDDEEKVTAKLSQVKLDILGHGDDLTASEKLKQQPQKAQPDYQQHGPQKLCKKNSSATAATNVDSNSSQQPQTQQQNQHKLNSNDKQSFGNKKISKPIAM